MKTINLIKHYGTLAEVGKLCGCSPQAVSRWGVNVPHLRQYQIEVITGGLFKSDFSNKNIQKESD